MGIIFNRGRGLASLEKALAENPVVPQDIYRVPKEALTDKQVLKEARRADSFSKMATLAAYDALADSAIPEEHKQKIGIILSTALGPHVTTFGFLDDILTYGDAGVSPTLFSHSVHNAAASYIALNLQTRGPTLTLTQFGDSFRQAIILAECWLKENRCSYILVGAVDQLGKVLEYICSQKLKPPLALGEGSAFFLLTNDSKYSKYCSISALAQTTQTTGELSLPADNFAPIFGHSFSLSSFSCAAGALMLKKQTFTVHKIESLRYNCSQEESKSICLYKPSAQKAGQNNKEEGS